MTEREDAINRIERVIQRTNNSSITVTIPKYTAKLVVALLKEQEAVLAHWDDDTEHWIEGDRDGIDPHTRTTGEMIDTFRCSWCGFYQYWKTPFCPNCGAKMEGR